MNASPSSIPSAPPACVIVKHANPCGVAEGASLLEAYRKALACDPTSAFGGIVALNRTLDAEAAQGDHRDLHRGDHRAGRDRRSDRDRRGEEEPAPAAGRRPARSARRRADGEVGRRRPAGAVARQCGGRRDAAQDRHQARAERSRTRRPALRLPRRQAREVEHHRLCQGSRHRRHRRRADEPRRCRAHRRAQGGRRREGS